MLFKVADQSSLSRFQYAVPEPTSLSPLNSLEVVCIAFVCEFWGIARSLSGLQQRPQFVVARHYQRHGFIDVFLHGCALWGVWINAQFISLSFLCCDTCNLETTNALPLASSFMRYSFSLLAYTRQSCSDNIVSI